MYNVRNLQIKVYVTSVNVSGSKTLDSKLQMSISDKYMCDYQITSLIGIYH